MLLWDRSRRLPQFLHDAWPLFPRWSRPRHPSYRSVYHHPHTTPKTMSSRLQTNKLNPHSPPTETQVDHILHLIDRYQTEPTIHSFQPSHAATTDFLSHVATVMPRTVWSDPTCRSSFKSPQILNNLPLLWPGSLLHYMEALRELRAEDWDFTYRGNRFAYLGKVGLSQAEFDPSCDLAYYIRARDEGKPVGSRAMRREVVTRSGTQRPRELHMPLRRDPEEIVLE